MSMMEDSQNKKISILNTFPNYNKGKQNILDNERVNKKTKGAIFRPKIHVPKMKPYIAIPLESSLW